MYIVTGASAGIGKAIAETLASRGLPVAAVARSSSPLNALKARYPASVVPVVADLSTGSGIETVVSAVSGERAIAGLVHCAGSLVPLDPYVSIQPGELVEHFRIHVASQIAIYQALAADRTIARMMMIDSYSASAPRDSWAAYSILKSAAQMAARCARQELSETLTVRIYPGAVDTQVVESVLASNTKTATIFAEMRQAGKLAQPADVAAFITAILVDAPDELLRSIEAWDYNEEQHQTLVSELANTRNE